MKIWGIVFASVNPVNLDAAISYVIDFNLSDIRYLYFLAGRSIERSWTTLEQCSNP